MERKKTLGGHVIRFIVTVVWVILALVITFVSVAALVGGDFADLFGIEGSTGLYVVGIGISALFALVTFLVPYLRKRGTTTRWCGICALADVAWWIYLLIAN